MTSIPFIRIGIALLPALVVYISSACISTAHADSSVEQAMALTARDFDAALPDQRIARWLRSAVPARYEVVWGKYLTDCGEGTGTAYDKERDLPSCLEVEVKESSETTAYLLLAVGTERRGIVKDRCGLFFGYVNRGGKNEYLKRLSDLQKIWPSR